MEDKKFVMAVAFFILLKISIDTISGWKRPAPQWVNNWFGALSIDGIVNVKDTEESTKNTLCISSYAAFSLVLAISGLCWLSQPGKHDPKFPLLVVVGCFICLSLLDWFGHMDWFDGLCGFSSMKGDTDEIAGVLAKFRNFSLCIVIILWKAEYGIVANNVVSLIILIFVLEMLLKRFGFVPPIVIENEVNKCDLWTGVRQWDWDKGNAGQLIGKFLFSMFGIIFLYAMLGTFYYLKTPVKGWITNSSFAYLLYYFVIALLVLGWDGLLGWGLSSYAGETLGSPKDILEIVWFWLLPKSWVDGEDDNWDAQDLFTVFSKCAIILCIIFFLGRFFLKSPSFGNQRKLWWVLGSIGIVIYIIVPLLIFLTSPKCKIKDIFRMITTTVDEKNKRGSYSGFACALHKFGGLQTLFIFILWFMYNEKSGRSSISISG